MPNLFDIESLPVATEDGHFVSEKHMRLVEVIREYDRNLDVEWIPDGKRSADDAPFRVVHTHPVSGYRYVVCYADDLDGPLLERIIKMDAQRNGNILSDIDAHNAAIKALAQKKWEEEKAEAIDLAYHIFRSPKTRYKHDGRVYE